MANAIPADTVPVWELTTPVTTPSPRPSATSENIASNRTSNGTEYDSIIAMSEQRGEYGDTSDVDPGDQNDVPASTGSDDMLASALMHQDADALEILRQLPTRDDWHGDVGTGSPYAQFRKQQSRRSDASPQPTLPHLDSATSYTTHSVYPPPVSTQHHGRHNPESTAREASPTAISRSPMSAFSKLTASGSPTVQSSTGTTSAYPQASRATEESRHTAHAQHMGTPPTGAGAQPRMSTHLDITSNALTPLPVGSRGSFIAAQHTTSPDAAMPLRTREAGPGTAGKGGMLDTDTGTIGRPLGADSTGSQHPAPTTPQRRPPALDVQSPLSAHESVPNAALVCARQGTAHLRNGELELARKCYERGLGAHPSNNIKMVLLARLGEVCRVLRDFDSAVQYATQHVGLATAFKATKETYRAQRTKGMSNLAWALQLLESLENDGDELADQERPAEMLNDALRSFEDIVHKATAMNDYLVVARAHRDIMKVHQVLGNDAQALEAAEKHLALIRGRGSKHDIGRAVCSCAALRAVNGVNGDITWTKREFEGVLELLWEQAAIGEEVHDLELIGNAYYQISKLMEDAGSWADWYGPAKARQFLQKAIAAFDGIETPNARQVTQKEDCEQRLEALNTEGSCSIQ